MGFVYIVQAFASMYTTKIMIIIHILIFIFDFNMSFNKADYIINCCRPYILWFAFGLVWRRHDTSATLFAELFSFFVFNSIHPSFAP